MSVDIWADVYRIGVQDAVVEALFRAYFSDGRDIGRRDVLIAIATSAGVAATDAGRLLGSGEGEAEVLAEERQYKGMGIEGVPAIVVGGTVAVSGAAQPEVIVEVLRRAPPGTPPLR